MTVPVVGADGRRLGTVARRRALYKGRWCDCWEAEAGGVPLGRYWNRGAAVVAVEAAAKRTGVARHTAGDQTRT